MARGFESFQILTVDGKIFSGMVVNETASHLTVRTTDQREHRIVRQDIEQMQPSRVSIMPKGLDKTMSIQQISDLLAYLQSLKQ